MIANNQQNREWEKLKEELDNPERLAILIASDMVNKIPFPAGVILSGKIVYHNIAFKRVHGMLRDENKIQITDNPSLSPVLEQVNINGIDMILFSLH
jgi:hypothetical protein